MIKVENLDYSVDDNLILKDISLNIKKGKFTGIVGPNGSGKSSLLKNIYKAVNGDGNIIFKGKHLNTVSIKELAREMAVVSQHGGSEFDFTVEEMVTMGRYPHKGIFKGYNNKDKEIVLTSLKKVGLINIKDRSFFTLSGGERQRVLIARALAQQADIIILDEPTNHLDISYQLEIMETLKSLGITVVAAIHDMNIAALYCDDLIALKDGKIWSTGKIEDIFSETFFREVFSVETEINKNLKTNKMAITYIPRRLLG